jgi:ADP-ribose pyrophosphatase YjhB (NUDIX family)
MSGTVLNSVVTAGLACWMKPGMEMASSGSKDRQMKYCSQCAAPLAYRTPQGDDRPRHICDRCNTVHYQNPKVVVGCIPVWENKILLCRRAIEPGLGKWTLPAGYLENGETAEQGAVRETVEEAGAAVQIIQPYALYSLTFADHIYFMFYARMLNPHFNPGEESISVKLFNEAEIPWEGLAFKVVKEILKQFLRERSQNKLSLQVGEIARR